MTDDVGPSGAVVQAHGLCRAFGDVVAVDGLDLELNAGEVQALVGLNGAGKSTLMRLMVGLLRPDAGHVSLWGRPAWQAPAAVRSRIGYVSSSHLYPELTVTDHVTWAARLHGCRRREARRRADDMIDQLALRRWASRPARTLSTGNRQRLAIATALIHDPDLMIFDEPTTGLDPAGVIDLRRIIAERVTDGTSVLVSSHHLDEVARVASVINVMHAGRLVGHLAPEGLDLERQFFRTVAAAAEERP